VIFYFTLFIRNNYDTIFIVMADGTTYGLTFPFRESFDGKYLDLSDYNDQEIRSNLIHLLLTRKGSRYYLPDFGTRLYEFLFDPLDTPTFSQIDLLIRNKASIAFSAFSMLERQIALSFPNFKSMIALIKESLSEKY